MSKLTTRVLLSVLISLAILIGVFMSVQAASLVSSEKSLGMYVLNGGLVNPLQPPPAPETQEEAAPQLQPFPGSNGEGRGGCESEKYIDPNDL